MKVLLTINGGTQIQMALRIRAFCLLVLGWMTFCGLPIAE